ncbi:endonuclease [Parabacteroides sp. OttesenSCG-928-G07]|nr:endonuclease [Parabacteroides sp. OttesenSCG-928-G21]MDL2278420.1 endonuclease [Parabacteroides sp. OttesenSCG-928-G07]
MKYLLLFSFLCLSFIIAAQQTVGFRVMWYNVENLFDTQDNPKTNDDEFLPGGNRRWTPKRYNHKLQQLAKVITAAGEWDTPALVGLCEVENDSVILDLLNRTPLKKQQYRYCMTTGSDTRGIQVALLYQRDKFALLGNSSIPVLSSGKHHKPTRDILHVWGKVASQDTLDLFLCHFPSRSGGEKETEANRMDAAAILRSLCDSIANIRETPFILLMGDFNDEPSNKSIKDILCAYPLSSIVSDLDDPRKGDLKLYNLFSDPKRQSFPGSYKYQGGWTQLDQIIVSETLIQQNNTIHIWPESARLFSPSFILTKDKTWQGVRPKRTYYGYKYEGGFSDHFPLLLDLVVDVKFPE